MPSLLDAAGRCRSPATLPGLRHTADDRHGFRLRAMIVVLWRAGVRIHEALALTEHDLDPRRGSVLVRSGKGGRRREVGMDARGWDQMRPWLDARHSCRSGRCFASSSGPTRGRPWSGASVRREFRRIASDAGVRRRFAPSSGSAAALPLPPDESRRRHARVRCSRGSSNAGVTR